MLFQLSLTPHYASDYSVFMALVDLVPVALFFIAGLILISDLYHRLSKVNYALLSSGVIMVLVAGLCKAIWKIICALGITDFVVFNFMFMPIQSIGFALTSIGLIGVFKKKKSCVKMNSFFPIAILPLLLSTTEQPLEMTNSSIPFLAIQTIGGSAMLVLLMILSQKMNHKAAFWMFVISFITMWGMGGLAACQNSMSTTLWNWLEEIDNTVSQGTLLLGVYFLHKSGLNQY